ncbi:hypothetical protein [Hoeflea sp.]|uniref:hypothetical protein n=1 Tax=Hoeflea sp. TaxID=1940281 RepID=UPI003B522763
MTSLLEKARASWAESRDGKMHVPEWGVTVHFKAMTLREHRVFEQSYENDPTLAIATLVQTRALDEKGKRLFDDELSTTTALRDDVDPVVLLDLATRMRGKASVAQAEKN